MLDWICLATKEKCTMAQGFSIPGLCVVDHILELKKSHFINHSGIPFYPDQVSLQNRRLFSLPFASIARVKAPLPNSWIRPWIYNTVQSKSVLHIWHMAAMKIHDTVLVAVLAIDWILSLVLCFPMCKKLTKIRKVQVQCSNNIFAGWWHHNHN